jgi:hypothetical protein
MSRSWKSRRYFCNLCDAFIKEIEYEGKSPNPKDLDFIHYPFVDKEGRNITLSVCDKCYYILEKLYENFKKKETKSK